MQISEVVPVANLMVAALEVLPKGQKAELRGVALMEVALMEVDLRGVGLQVEPIVQEKVPR